MLISIALISLTAPLQEVSEAAEREPLAMHYFTPDEEHLYELYEQARDLFRRDVPRPSGAARDGSADNLFLLGDSIVVYDTKAYSAVVLRNLEEMQNAWRGQEEESPSAPKLVAEELRVTNISAFDAYEALSQHRRQVQARHGRAEPFSNVKFIQDANIVLLRDTLEKVATMRALVERIDRPAPQVQLSFLVVQASPAGNGEPLRFDPRVPPDLVQALAEMLPNMSLELASSAFLRTVASGGVERQVYLPDEGTAGRYAVSLRLDAFDERTGMLGLGHCELSYINQGSVSAHFSTGTSIPMGEYVVIGSNGASPTLLVLRAVRADRAPQRSAGAQDLTR